MSNVKNIVQILNELNEGDNISFGAFEMRKKNGVVSPIVDPVHSDENQRQVSDTFGYLWEQRKCFESEESIKGIESDVAKFSSNFSASFSSLCEEIDMPIVLDAGCGAGYSAFAILGDLIKQKKLFYFGVDISDAVYSARAYFDDMLYEVDNVAFMKIDLNDIPDTIGQFNAVLSYGVLHHTPNVCDSIVELSKRINPEGRFIFRIINQQKPLRKLTDQYMRKYFSQYSDPNEAFQKMLPFSKFGTALGEALGDAVINVPEDVPEMGLKKGRIEAQRFIYDYLLRAYYQPGREIARTNIHTYDWFYPNDYHETSVSDVKEYLSKAGLKLLDIQETDSVLSIVSQK